MTKNSNPKKNSNRKVLNETLNKYESQKQRQPLNYTFLTRDRHIQKMAGFDLFEGANQSVT